jgi:N-methylhydantoinase A
MVNFDTTGFVMSPVYDRLELLHGNIIDGPAIIEEAASTTVVEPGDRVTVNEYGHLVMQLVGAA